MFSGKLLVVIALFAGEALRVAALTTPRRTSFDVAATGIVSPLEKAASEATLEKAVGTIEKLVEQDLAAPVQAAVAEELVHSDPHGRDLQSILLNGLTVQVSSMSVTSTYAPCPASMNLPPGVQCITPAMNFVLSVAGDLSSLTPQQIHDTLQSAVAAFLNSYEVQDVLGSVTSSPLALTEISVDVNAATAVAAPAGSTNAPTCFTTTNNPGCGQPNCIDSICAYDSWCCYVDFDGICVFEAFADPACVAPQSLAPPQPSCFVEHGTTGCLNDFCEKSVCSYDSWCCVMNWDWVCVKEANYDPNCKPSSIDVEGDPHFKSWSGKWFDYMGQCDLKLVESHNFDGHQDLSIHIRTKIIYDYSFVETAAIQIGSDILEVGGYGDYAVNGVDTPFFGEKVGSIGGYDLFHNEVSKKKNTYDIVLGPNENITLASYKNLVSVQVNVASPEKYFANSKGIVGSINGDLLSRSGKVMDPEQDEAAFGQEWQITDSEVKLFRSDREPQYPAKCEMPTRAASTQRRLGETIAEEAAMKACSHKKGPQFNNCVYDVMVIGDLELAEFGVY